jgi:creatinine amidohydrolase
VKLSDLTWPEVEQLDRDVLVIVPIAALEQHSHHLPLFTDTILCEGVVQKVEETVASDVLLLPVQWLGASAHHLGMPGTLSADLDTHVKLICEPIRCLLKHGFRRFLVVNGHGGNIDGFHLALRQLLIEFPSALFCGASYWELAEKEIARLLEGPQKSVGHACEFETSLMMHLRPELVRTDRLKDDGVINPAPDGVYLPLDFKRQTHQGAAGYPTLASAIKGQQLLNIIVEKIIQTLQALRTRSLSCPQ